MSRLFTPHDNNPLMVPPSLKRQSQQEPLPEADLVLVDNSATSAQVSAAIGHMYPSVFPGDDTKLAESLRCLLSFFAFSRIIGMCPISREDSEILVRNKLHPSWYFTWFAIAVKTAMWINHAYRSFPLSNLLGALVYAGNGFLYFTHILASCLYMTWKVEEIPRWIQSFNNVEKMLKSYEVGTRKTGLIRHTFLLILFFITAEFGGHVIYHTARGKIKIL